MKSFTTILWITIISLITISCVSVFSELQSARTAGKNHLEASGSYSESGLTQYTRYSQTHLGMQTNFGISKNVDIRFRYEKILPSDYDKSITIAGIGPKISLAKDKVALSLLLVRTMFPGGPGSYHTQTSFIFSIPLLKDKIEITLAPKAIILLSRDPAASFAINSNLAFSTNLKKWALRPEIGFLWGGAWQGSLAFTYNFGS